MYIATNRRRRGLGEVRTRTVDSGGAAPVSECPAGQVKRWIPPDNTRFECVTPTTGGTPNYSTNALSPELRQKWTARVQELTRIGAASSIYLSMASQVKTGNAYFYQEGGKNYFSNGTWLKVLSPSEWNNPLTKIYNLGKDAVELILSQKCAAVAAAASTGGPTAVAAALKAAGCTPAAGGGGDFPASSGGGSGGLVLAAGAALIAFLVLRD